jgi:dienelactone hydrolase
MKQELFHNALVYGLPDMEKVVVRNVEYRSHGDTPLTMDIYYPPGAKADARLPAVIFVMGYKDTSPVIGGSPLKDFFQYRAWGRLTAASGLVAIMYQTLQFDDLAGVVEYIKENAESLNVDDERLGLWSCSGNSATAVSFAMQKERDYLRFSVFYYGFLLTPDNRLREEINRVCGPRGCYAEELENVVQLRPDLPLLIVRAGLDSVDFINESIDHFVSVALDANAPFTLVNFPEGIHGFDIEEWWPDSPHCRSGEIVRQTLAFMRSNLRVE